MVFGRFCSCSATAADHSAPALSSHTAAAATEEEGAEHGSSNGLHTYAATSCGGQPRFAPQACAASD